MHAAFAPTPAEVQRACLFAGCTILAVPSFRNRIPVVLDRVTTLCGPGEWIDVVATERGLAIHPRRQDLLDAMKGSDVPLISIQDLKREVERTCGGAPARARTSEQFVAAIQWVDGTTIDAVHALA